MILVFFPARFFLATMYWAKATLPNRAQTLALAAAPTLTTAVLSMTVRCSATNQPPSALPAEKSRSSPPLPPTTRRRVPAGGSCETRNQRSSVLSASSHSGGKKQNISKHQKYFYQLSSNMENRRFCFYFLIFKKNHFAESFAEADVDFFWTVILIWKEISKSNQLFFSASNNLSIYRSFYIILYIYIFMCVCMYSKPTNLKQQVNLHLGSSMFYYDSMRVYR